MRLSDHAAVRLSLLHRWLTAVKRDGWILLVPDPDEERLGKPLAEAGFEHRQVSSARGTLLCKVIRRREQLGN
jgi:hypothetical protein